MSVELRVGSVVWLLGTAESFESFFSTVAAVLEPGGWGSRFPVVQRTLYAGRLPATDAPGAAEELRAIAAELRGRPADELVWDYRDRSRAAPDPVPAGAGDLAARFVTAGGESLLAVLDEAVGHAATSGRPLAVEVTPPVVERLLGAEDPQRGGAT